MNAVLTIAGSDCSGGAGIQADLKTITAHKLYGMSVITALTAQNTTKVFGIAPTTPAFIETQMDAVFTDIRPKAVKIGMLLSAEIIEVVANKLIQYKAENIVLDPVMIATSGRRLLDREAEKQLKKRLIPIVDLITPNIKETEVLTGSLIDSEEDMINAASKFNGFYNGTILIKGGHLKTSADDLLYQMGEIHWLKGSRVGDKDRHGTGCTLSSAIACNLALGLDLKTAACKAKEYVRGALETDTFLGKGSTPLDHGYLIK